MFRYKAKEFDIASIKKIVSAYHQTEDPHLKKHHDYYNGQQKIFSKQVPEGRPNNKVMSNYCQFITDCYCGYINLGAATCTSDLLMDNMDILSDCLKDSLIGGIGYLLMYLDDAKPYMAKLNPATTVIVYDTSIAQHILGAVTWSKYTVFNNGQEEEQVDMYIYNDTTVSLYQGSTVESAELVSEEPHYMGMVPIFEIKSSFNYSSIFDQIFSLQDMYNYLLSTYEDSRETFNNSFLVISGIGVDQTAADELIDGTNKILNLPLPDSQAYYLTKEDKAEDTLSILEKLRKEMLSITSTPDFEDYKAGVSSGMAIRMRLTAFIQACNEIETQFEDFVRLYEEATGKEIDWKWNSLIPSDLETTVNAIVKLRDLVSDETLLSQVPFIDDPQAELRKVEKERQNAKRYNSNNNSSTDNSSTGVDGFDSDAPGGRN